MNVGIAEIILMRKIQSIMLIEPIRSMRVL